MQSPCVSTVVNSQSPNLLLRCGGFILIKWSLKMNTALKFNLISTTLLLIVIYFFHSIVIAEELVGITYFAEASPAKIFFIVIFYSIFMFCSILVIKVNNIQFGVDWTFRNDMNLCIRR